VKPVAMTLGDAAGIGPEIVVKALSVPGVQQDWPSFVVGPAPAVERAVQDWAPGIEVRRMASGADYRPTMGVIDVLDVGSVPADLAMGRVDARAGRAAYEAIAAAISLALAGDVDAICTAPIHKASLAAAGLPYPGHTEILADHSGSDDTAMLLLNSDLRTMLVTVHCALSQVPAQLTVEHELRIIRLAHRTLQGMGIARPRIAVAGLNPHGGEGGLFGREEIDAIAPAIARARAQGIDATGPHPGDTVFMQARRGRYDLVVAQYHDQGLIPIKLLGVEDGVNVTAGLPFVRTSPDHGTAFDIAGRGLADPTSLITALRTAHQLAAMRTSQPRGATHRS
jgi:4-hydroxythreonine-4-phosphate dehydrogenase